VTEIVIRGEVEQHDGLELHVLGGGIVSLSSEAQAAVSPLARLDVEAPIPIGSRPDWWPRLHVVADFTALPGESVQLAAPETFKALEFGVGVSQRLFGGGGQEVRAYASAGFATRLPDDPTPRDKTVRYASAGLRFAALDRSAHLQLGLGGDQRLDGSWQAAVVVDGAVTLYRAREGTLKGARVALVGSAILGLDLSTYSSGLSGGRRDVVRVGVAIGR
jgi:hypothetical protein